MLPILPVIKKAVGIIKKVFLVIAVYFVVVSLFMYFLNKDRPKISYDPIQKNRDEIYKVINDKKLNSSKEGRITVALYRMMTCGFVGEACTKNPNDGDKNYNHSILGFVGNLIALPYTNPPASGVYWVYSKLENAGFVPKSYAAEGIGFAAIKPFIKIWSAFRNFAYIILVIVMISIGFMIMFRAKINPQTVISVENSLPRIVIALLLITFSYAIAGFMIDLMYVLILIIISTLSTINIDPYKPANAFSLMNDYVSGSSSKLLSVKFNLINTGNYLLSILPLGLGTWFKFIGGFLSSLGMASLFWKKMRIEDAFTGGFKDLSIQAATFGFGIGDLPKIVAAIIFWILTFLLTPFALPLLVGLLVGLTVLFLFFRIFFLLLTNYLQILLLIFFAPLIMLFEAIPGKNTFSWWFKNMLANLITFPFVILIIIVSDIIYKINLQVGTNQFWAPPFLYPLNQDSIIILVGLGLYLILPDLVKALKEALGAKGLPFSLGLGTFFGGAATALGGVKSATMGISSLTQIPFVGPAILNAADKQKHGIFGNLFPESVTDRHLRDLIKLTKKNQGGQP